MEYGRSGRPEPELLREHCQRFSRLGWALLAQMAAMAAVQAAAAVAAGLTAPELLTSPVFLWLLSVLSVYGAGFLAFCLVLRGTPAPPPAQARPLPPVRFLQLWVICLCVTYLANLMTLTLMDLIGLLRGAAVENPVDQTAAYPPVLNALLGCLIAPVEEELMFRKLLLDRLRPYGERFAVLASALCFGLFHGNLNQLFYACAIGLVLGWVALRTGRVWQPILLHAMVNAIATVLLPLLEPAGALGEGVLSALVLGSILLGAAFLAGLRQELSLPRGTGPLPPRWTWRVFFESPGVVCFCLLSLALCGAYFLS